MQARRVVCPTPGHVELERVDLPDPQGAQVLVETEVTLVSPGTERAWFLNEPDTPVKFPYHPGYAHVGRITAVGPSAGELQVGERVLTSASHASAALVRADQVVRVPEGISPEELVFAKLGAISLQGVRKARIELGSSVALIGAGLIGLLALKFARLSGAHPLVVSDLSAHRLEVARSSGADQAVAPDALAALSGEIERNAVPDWGFDVVIDATGHPAALGSAIEACGTRGRIILLGSTRGRADQVNVYEIHRKGLQIIGAHARNTPRDASHEHMWRSRDNTELIVRLLRDKRVRVDDLISDRVQPEAVPALFGRLAARDDKLLACVIDWR